MYKFVLFLKKISTVLLFVVLEIIAGYSYFRSSPYQRAVAINVSNEVLGFIHRRASSISDFFNLPTQNRQLAEENAMLRNRLSAIDSTITVPQLQTPQGVDLPSINFRITTHDSSALVHHNYQHNTQNNSLYNRPNTTQNNTKTDKYIPARVIRNTVFKQQNYITINKGTNDGIAPQMALVDSQGIVGYVLACSKNYSVAMSILNVDSFRTGGKIGYSDNTATISWDGSDHQIVQFNGVPRYAQINIGDTIRSTFSNRFPDNYPIGRIKEYTLVNNTTYNVQVQLFADMYRLRYVYAISNPTQAERIKLEESIITE